MSDNLMSIGAFSFRSGLTIPALRHYDEAGLLPPTVVDAKTGYRRYHPDQIRTARLICGLRAVDLPVDEIREVLNLDDASIQVVLEEHRQRLADRMRTLTRMTATLNEYLERKSPMPEPAGSRPVQMTIHADDVGKAVAFYSRVFGAEFIEPISSFQFGAWNTDSFFLLTIEPQTPENPNYPGRNASLGFWVDDLDDAFQRALDAGGTEVHPPREFEHKPRTALVDDPSGNRLALTQR